MAERFLRMLDAAELTDVGLVRERNEDTSKILIPPPGLSQAALGALFMVVDGMGGLGGGDVASKYGVAEIARYYYTDETRESDPLSRLQAALQSASDIVAAQAVKVGLPRIGATAAGMVLSPAGDLIVFNVGDCRVYRIRSGKIERVSHDQSVMEREIDAGMSPERAAQVTRSSMVTAFLGQPVPLQPNIVQDHVQRGDVYVICSDGLWSLMDPLEIMQAAEKSPAKVAVQKLIKLALKRGGQDNVTAVVVRIGSSGRLAGFVRRLVAALIFAALLTAGAIAVRTVNGAPIQVIYPILIPSLTQTPAPTTPPTSTAVPASNTPMPTASPTARATNTPTAVPTKTPAITVTVVLLIVATESASTLEPTASPLPSDPPIVGTVEPTVTLNPFVVTYTLTPTRTRIPTSTRKPKST